MTVADGVCFWLQVIYCLHFVSATPAHGVLASFTFTCKLPRLTDGFVICLRPASIEFALKYITHTEHASNAFDKILRPCKRNVVNKIASCVEMESRLMALNGGATT